MAKSQLMALELQIPTRGQGNRTHEAVDAGDDKLTMAEAQFMALELQIPTGGQGPRTHATKETGHHNIAMAKSQFMVLELQPGHLKNRAAQRICSLPIVCCPEHRSW